MTTLFKPWLPPGLTELYKQFHGGGIQFKGNYADWASAARHAEGYDVRQILDKVRHATRRVVCGEAACERDSILFKKVPYPFPVVAILLRAAMENHGRLDVLDFGGALGSSYYQCRDFLKRVSPLHWCVVEQAHYVECGRREFQSDTLWFYESIESCMQMAPPQVILVSGVLQYLPNPFEVLGRLAQTGADYIVIDRTPFSLTGKQMISVQSVPREIYRASYPLWLFDEESLKAPLLRDYDEIARFDAVDGTLGTGSLTAEFRGIVFSKKGTSAR